MIKNRPKARICLCGDGWGAMAALKGLELKYSDVIVVSNDEDVIKHALNKRIKVSHNLEQVDAKLYLCSGYTQILKEDFLKRRLALERMAFHHRAG